MNSAVETLERALSLDSQAGDNRPEIRQLLREALAALRGPEPEEVNKCALIPHIDEWPEWAQSWHPRGGFRDDTLDRVIRRDNADGWCLRQRPRGEQ